MSQEYQWDILHTSLLLTELQWDKKKWQKYVWTIIRNWSIVIKAYIIHYRNKETCINLINSSKLTHLYCRQPLKSFLFVQNYKTFWPKMLITKLKKLIRHWFYFRYPYSFLTVKLMRHFLSLHIINVYVTGKFWNPVFYGRP